ncbi:hypothetical protein VNO80_26871 [Phaseolus coccineus]|uniref:Uncharacterized protein n=1 Tax=Phaseolus coccineus TaxID=3886 RepID=A0AAN9LFI7_PHACN
MLLVTSIDGVDLTSNLWVDAVEVESSRAFHLLASDVESEHTTFGRSKTNVVCPIFGGRGEDEVKPNR